MRPLFPGIAAVALGRWRRVVVDVVGEPEQETEDQEGTCKAARDAIAAGGEVMLYDGQPPQWMVFGIAATRLKRSLRIGLTTLGLDETVEILRARHRDEQLRTGNIVAADRSWFFTLYFEATGTELLACSGVKNERPSWGGRSVAPAVEAATRVRRRRCEAGNALQDRQ
ncbi:hypothetical protein ACFVY9_35940 [Streptomyces sp. NPDC059544]|uniref:hypothetical protein n=1 Tax=Streptomyces sp. NPDC059544 TaxID=3346861 RepID=UPI00368FFB97